MDDLAGAKRPNPTLVAIRQLRHEFQEHVAHDAREFESVRAELRADHAEAKASRAETQGKLDTLTAAQKTATDLQEQIAAALKIGTNHKPVLLMGRWELLWKVGGSVAGLVLIYRGVWESAPYLVAIAKVIAHLQ